MNRNISWAVLTVGLFISPMFASAADISTDRPHFSEVFPPVVGDTIAGLQSIMATSEASTSAGGLFASYFPNKTLSGSSTLMRIEPVDFTWVGTTTPGDGIPADNWSVQWKGHILWPTSGTYTLQIIADDGLRVMINAWNLPALITVDKWEPSGNVTYTLPPVTVSAGWTSTIRIEHYDGTGNSTVKLRWKTPNSGIYFSTIPGSALLPY